MADGLLSDFTEEKNNLKKLLIGSRMEEISYSETINLFFNKDVSDYKGKQKQFVLILDAPCWFGDRDQWTSRVNTLKKDNALEGIEDCLLVFELTRLRYHNLIQVRSVDFHDDFMAIEYGADISYTESCSIPGMACDTHAEERFKEKNTLYIPYYAQSDYAWILEEVSSKSEEDKISICCQGNMLYQSNMPKDQEH